MDITCDNCQKPIGTKESPAYRVQIGLIDEKTGNFEQEELLGFFCSGCAVIELAKEGG